MTRTIFAAYDAARREVAEAKRAYFLAPTDEARYIAAARYWPAYFALRATSRRMLLSMLAYIVAALVIVGVVYGLLVIGWAALGPVPAPIPTDYQLPTL